MPAIEAAAFACLHGGIGDGLRLLSTTDDAELTAVQLMIARAVELDDRRSQAMAHRVANEVARRFGGR